jgi:hypothetical protein
MLVLRLHEGLSAKPTDYINTHFLLRELDSMTTLEYIYRIDDKNTLELSKCVVNISDILTMKSNSQPPNPAQLINKSTQRKSANSNG